jgi:hypothetical protein
VGSNPAGGMDICRLCCLLSRTDLCVGLITRPEESYRLRCVCVCVCVIVKPRLYVGPRPLWAVAPLEKKNARYSILQIQVHNCVQHVAAINSDLPTLSGSLRLESRPENYSENVVIPTSPFYTTFLGLLVNRFPTDPLIHCCVLKSDSQWLLF